MNNAELVTDTRGRSVSIDHCKPSLLAKQFLHSTCGSMSGYESGYASDTSRRQAGSNLASTSTNSSVETPEETEDNEEVFPPSSPRNGRRFRPTRQLTVHPTLSPSSNPHPRGHTAPAQRVLRPIASAHILGYPTSPLPIPSLEEEEEVASLELSGSVPSRGDLEVPARFRRSKSPTLFLPSAGRQKQRKQEMRKKNKTLDPRGLQLERDPSADYHYSSLSSSQVFLGFNPGHTISSPVHRPLDPPAVQLREIPPGQLRRGNAIKRRSVQDLVKINRLSYDVS